MKETESSTNAWLDREIHYQEGVTGDKPKHLTIREALSLIGDGSNDTSHVVNAYRNRNFDAEVAANELQNFKNGKPTSEKNLGKLIQQSKAATKLAKDLKSELPAVCFAGLFNGRCKNKYYIPESCTGIFVVDIDKLNPADLKPTKEKLMAIPECVFIFLSPSEKGFKAGFEVNNYRDDRENKVIFAFMDKFLSDNHNITIDQSCKNVSRLCFLSLDSEIYIRAGAIS